MNRSSLLTWRDLASMFRCGRNKAMKILHMLDPIYIGRTPYVPVSHLQEYFKSHNEIKIDWRY